MPDVHELGASLRKALDTAKRTAQLHLKAVQDAETAISAYERAAAEQTEELSRERAALDDERRAFEDERRAFEDGAQHEQGMDTRDGEEQGHEESSQAEEQGMSTQGNTRDRSRSRSRSRSKGRPDPVQDAAARLGLDATALQQIQQFPPDDALNMLFQVPDDVRNASAFVTKMCQRAHQTGVGLAASDADPVEGAIQDLGLDDGAARVLRDIPQEQATNILDQINESVRNPSAFIMSLAHRAGKGKGTGKAPPAPSMEDRVNEHIQRLALDQGAARIISELSPEHALSILELVGDDVRNPSAFVTAEARKALNSGAGKGRQDGGSNTAASAALQFSQQIDELARSLDLDESCLEALHGISAQDATQILELLASNIATIRNRSAFVFAEVKKLTRGRF